MVFAQGIREGMPHSGRFMDATLGTVFGWSQTRGLGNSRDQRLDSRIVGHLHASTDEYSFASSFTLSCRQDIHPIVMASSVDLLSRYPKGLRSFCLLQFGFERCACSSFSSHLVGVLQTEDRSPYETSFSISRARFSASSAISVSVLGFLLFSSGTGNFGLPSDLSC